MNVYGFLILWIPLMGLVPICREKRWNWRVAKSSNLLTVLFWIGWWSSLVVGVLTVIGVE